MLEHFITGDALTTLQRGGDVAVQALKMKANELMEDLRQRIVGQELSGGVLERRTGRLQSSVKVIPARVDGPKIRVGIQAGGDEAPYGTYFERGGVAGTYPIFPVNKKALAFFVGGQKVSFMTMAGRKEFIKNRTLVVVKAVLAHPEIPKKPFLEPPFMQTLPYMLKELQAVVPKAINKGDVSGII